MTCPPLYCPSRPFILLIIHRDQWVIQSYAALAAQPLIKTRLFSLHTSLRWFTSSSGQKGQLTFYNLFSDKHLSTRRFICVVLPKVWCHPQKTLNKVTFLHSKDTRGVQWYINSKSSVANIKTTIYPKFYIMEDTESCRGSSPDPFCISFYIQKVLGDLHYLPAKRAN